jgi:putative flippase GtrA
VEKSVVQSDRPVYSSPTDTRSGVMIADAPITPSLSLQLPSYHPTRWQFVNTSLDTIDRLSKGRAGWIQRFSTYFVIGGSAAVLNEVIFYVMLYQIAMPVPHEIHNVIANVTACEIATLANFAVNDYVTFRHLDGYQRSGYTRCLRFHMTAIGGIALTILLQALFHLVGKLSPVLSQTIAIGLVFIYNFAFHHIFTYRHTKAQKHS